MNHDRAARLRAIEEAGTSFAVEASAGTGKTGVLVRRILHLVLRDEAGRTPVPLSRICAITFTEKAAGEMKVRLRQELEKAAAGDDPPSERARAALRDLESASISTFHSFAVSLLKERPIEAGLDPRFSTLDETQRRLLFDNSWDEWIGLKLTEKAETLRAALQGGIGLEGLKSVARLLADYAHRIGPLELPAPPTSDELESGRKALRAQAAAWRRMVANPDDKLCERLENTIRWLERPSNGKPQKPGNAGSGKNWKGGKATVDAVRALINEAAELGSLIELLPGQMLLDRIVHWLREDFLRHWDLCRRAGGVLDFDDLLAATRSLLSKNRAARREFQRRYEAMLVDEFQDTDPVQLEIALLLTSPDLGESDPSRLRPAAGRIFIVGDPKQSIYRFRGADIETYLEATTPESAARRGIERLELTTNFRSVPSILRFIDKAFGASMTRAGNYQPEYLAFGGQGSRNDEPDPPGVFLIGDRDEAGMPAGSGGAFRELEAMRIARLIRRMIGSAEWPVLDTRAAGDQRRRPHYGDIAVLMPAMTHVHLLEDSLREEDIPYVLEGGKYYYRRSEVNSALTVLRALANPADAVALYGALRSIFFGLSDEDLLQARIEGIPFDYRQEPRNSSPLHGPYRLLRELHVERHSRPPSEILELLFQRTGAREVLAVRGFQSLANLAKLVRTARNQQAGRTFSEVVDLLVSMDEEGVEESESRLMEEQSDAVRILSVHRAKGLDFPIVIASGLGTQPKTTYPNLLADSHERRIFALRVSSGGEEIASPGFNVLKEEEKRRQAAEHLRLLYVVLTRAKDYLVISTHTKGSRDGSRRTNTASFAGTRLEPLVPLLERAATDGPTLLRWIDSASLEKPRPAQLSRLAPKYADWRARFRSECAELHRLLSTTPGSRLGMESGREDEEQEVAPPRSRAVRLGTAFHRGMEQVDLNAAGDVQALARRLSEEHALDPPSGALLEVMLRGCLASPLVARARRAAERGEPVYREVPYVRGTGGGGTMEEGKIDLLFREEGRWIIVDYKSDEIPADADVEEYFRARYSSQLLQYAVALRELGVQTHAAYLLLARNGREIYVGTDDVNCCKSLSSADLAPPELP